MLWKDYTRGVLRTEPDQDGYAKAHARLVDGAAYSPLTRLLGGLLRFIDRAETLDKIKKQVFYGKIRTYTREESHLDLRGDPIPHVANDRTMRVAHGILGMLTEAGELAMALCDVLRGKETLDSAALNLKEELGDLLWYLAVTCDALGLDVAEIQTANLAKLKARYPGKFTEQNAQERDLEKELIALQMQDRIQLKALDEIGKEVAPERYNKGVECIDEIRILLGRDGFIAFLHGQVVKYAYREGAKEGDAQKAEWYRQMLMHILTGSPDPRTHRPGFVPIDFTNPPVTRRELVAKYLRGPEGLLL